MKLSRRNKIYNLKNEEKKKKCIKWEWKVLKFSIPLQKVEWDKNLNFVRIIHDYSSEKERSIIRISFNVTVE
jgi:hypothetical protein